MLVGDFVEVNAWGIEFPGMQIEWPDAHLEQLSRGHTCPAALLTCDKSLVPLQDYEVGTYRTDALELILLLLCQGASSC